MNPIEVRIPHGLDQAEVRRRIERALEKARDEYSGQVGRIEASWRDDGRLDVGFSVMGMPIDAEAELAPGEVVVRVTLPALAGMFAGQIRSGIEQRIGGLLGSTPA